jgi:hypothetical protein
MVLHNTPDNLGVRRRDFTLGALACGTAALLTPTLGAAQGLLERLKEEIKGELKDLKEDVREEVAYFFGMEAYVYGYPIVIMDVTRQVLTAAPAPNAEGTAAPINQLAKMPHYVTPAVKQVVRISLNSLWTTGWVDLEQEPIVLSVPDTRERYYVFSLMNMWTNVFGSAGKRTTGTAPGNFLIVGPNWHGTAPADIKQTYRSSTRYAWILGQTQANGPDDFAAVNALQAHYKLTPLSAWGKPYTPPHGCACGPHGGHQDDPARPGDAHGRRHVLQPARDAHAGESARCRRWSDAGEAQETRHRTRQDF